MTTKHLIFNSSNHDFFFFLSQHLDIYVAYNFLLFLLLGAIALFFPNFSFMSLVILLQFLALDWYNKVLNDYLIENLKKNSLKKMHIIFFIYVLFTLKSQVYSHKFNKTFTNTLTEILLVSSRVLIQLAMKIYLIYLSPNLFNYVQNYISKIDILLTCHVIWIDRPLWLF